VWRTRYNDEIYKMYKDVTFSTYMCLKRLEGCSKRVEEEGWGGHGPKMGQSIIEEEININSNIRYKTKEYLYTTLQNTPLHVCCNKPTTTNM
jgi:hypothetical protein